MDIIDTHAFYGINEAINCNISHFNKLRKEYKGKGHNLNFLIVSASPETNYKIADVVKRNSEFILGAYLQIVPRKDLRYKHTSRDEIARLMERDEIKGLKVLTSMIKTPINDEILEPYMALAKEKDIPVMFHCCASGTDYTSYNQKKDFIKSHLDLKIILAHFGGLNPQFAKESMRLAEKYDNVYLNTTGMPGEDKRYDNDKKEFVMVQTPEENCLTETWEKMVKRAMKNKILRKKIFLGTDFGYFKEYSFGPLSWLAEKDQKQIMRNPIKPFNLK